MNKPERHDQIVKRIMQQGTNRVLSTRELADEFNVSEMTIRRDLQALADAGLIQRQHGGATLPKMRLHSPTHQRQVGIMLVSGRDKFTNPFFNELLEGVDRKLQELDYHSAFVKTDAEMQTAEQVQELLQAHPLDGLIIIGGLDTLSFPQWQAYIPTIVSTPSSIGIEYDAIQFDGFHGMCQMVNHLVSLGHRRIGFITGGMDSRLRGYLAGIVEHGLDDDPDLYVEIAPGLEDWTPKIGKIGADRLMNRAKPPDAIMCASDRIAIGALQWLQLHGYIVPEDVAVTGFDNIPDANFTIPALTSVHVHTRLLGQLAVERLHRRIENPNEIPLKIYTPTSLVIRHSCGAQ